MKCTFLNATLAVAFAAAAAIPGQVAKADEVVTVITSPVVISSQKTITTSETLSPGPSMLVTNSCGQSLMVPTSISPNPTLFVTTGAAITGFTCFQPDDLLTRRDDLLARIYVEKANGKLTDDQANGLINEVQNAYGARASICPGDESCVEHVKAVKKIYANFDKISNDILRDSHQGNKQLAGKYNVLVL